MPTIHETRPFNLRYIVREPRGIHGDDLRATHRTALCNYLYIMRQTGEDEHGPTPDFAARGDLVAHGRAGPLRAHADHLAGEIIWRAADVASLDPRPELPVAMHAVASLPPELDACRWRRLVSAFAEDELASRGMLADWAIHARRSDDGEIVTPPHAHLLITSRTWDGPQPGRWQRAWLTTPADVRKLGDAWDALTGLYPIGYVPPAAAAA